MPWNAALVGPGLLNPGERNAGGLWRRACDRLLGEGLPPNRYYGHDRLLRHYARVRLPYRLPGLLQHGWMLGTGIHSDISRHGDEERARTYFVWNERNRAESHALGYANAVAIGAPLLYLDAESLPSPANDDRSLLLFPLHAAEKARLVGGTLELYTEYLDSLAAILARFEPVTVCLYWMEHEDPRIRELFRRRGIPVTTLGHRDTTPRFLHRFADLVGRHAYVSSNHYSTAVFYSLFLGRRTFVYGPHFDLTVLPAERRTGTVQEILARDYPELLWDRFDGRNHRWIGERELGAEFKRTPGELRDLFDWRLSRLLATLSRRARRFVLRRLGTSAP